MAKDLLLKRLEVGREKSSNLNVELETQNISKYSDDIYREWCQTDHIFICIHTHTYMYTHKHIYIYIEMLLVEHSKNVIPKHIYLIIFMTSLYILRKSPDMTFSNE